jgi:putative transposase
VLGQLAEGEVEARERYESFVMDGLAEGQRREFQRGGEDSRVLGDDFFLEKVLDSAGEKRIIKPSLAHLIERVCRMYSINPEELSAAGQRRSISQARAVLGWLAQESGGCTLTEVGMITGRDVGSISSAVGRLVKRARGDAGLRAKLEAIREQVVNLET